MLMAAFSKILTPVVDVTFQRSINCQEKEVAMVWMCDRIKWPIR